VERSDGVFEDTARVCKLLQVRRGDVGTVGRKEVATQGVRDDQDDPLGCVAFTASRQWLPNQEDREQAYGRPSSGSAVGEHGKPSLHEEWEIINGIG